MHNKLSNLKNELLKKYVYDIDSYNNTHTGINLAQLIESIEQENNKIKLKEQFLSIIQLYFDGIIETQSKFSNVFLKPSKLNLLDDLILAGKKYVRDFYNGHKLQKDELITPIINNASKIIRYGSKNISKKRFLSYDNHLSCSDQIEDLVMYKQELEEFNITKTESKINSIVCVASGGFEPSLIAMSVFNTEPNNIIYTRYSIRTGFRNDESVKSPYSIRELEEKIFNKNILIVDDVIAMGTSLETVSKTIQSFEPLTLYGSVVENLYELYKKDKNRISKYCQPLIIKIE